MPNAPRKKTVKQKQLPKKHPAKKSSHLIEEKLDESSGKSYPDAPAPAKHPHKKKSFSWWAVVSLLLAIALGAIILYEYNNDFRANSNKLLTSIGLPAPADSAPGSADPSKTFVMKLNIVYDKDHPLMKTSIENYLKSLETNLTNTKVEANWMDQEDGTAKQLIEKLQAKSLPIFTTDSSITTHPQYPLFSGVIKQNNGEYQFESEGMEYLETPAVNGARFLGADPTTAQLLIVEYTSFSCGYCKAMHPILEKVIDTYGSKVSWVIKHFDRGGIDSMLSQAVECAADQGRLRPMIDKIFASQSSIFEAMQSTENPEKAVRDELARISGEAGADATKLGACLEAKTYQQKVADQTAEGVSFGVLGTPALFVGKTFVGGATDEPTFIGIVEEALKQ
jgi:protein-disulfide isomerase